MDARPAEFLIHGGVMIVTARVADYLNRHAGLDQFRSGPQGRTDPEVYQALIAIHTLSVRWSNFADEAEARAAAGTKSAAPAEPATHSRWLDTAQVAARLGIGPRAVRKAIEAGKLRSTIVGGRHQISREDLEHYRAARAA